MTSLTRRALVRAGAVGLALVPFVAGPEAYAASSTRRGLYTRQRFAALRQRTFRMDADGRSWRVRLVKVGNLPNCARRADNAFSLTFRAGRPGPASGTFVVRRRGFKPTSLFLVASDPERRTYQAVVFSAP